MESIDIQSEILGYIPTDGKKDAILSLGSTESFFNDIMSYGISISDIYQILEKEKNRRIKLASYIDTKEYKLIFLLRKYIDCYWDIRCTDRFRIFIDSKHLSEEILSIFSEAGFIFEIYEGNGYKCILDVEDPVQFYKNCITYDLDMEARYTSNLDTDKYKTYSSSEKYI